MCHWHGSSPTGPGRRLEKGADTYQAQSFDHLRGLAGISDGQIAEHLELYAGYVKQVNELTKELAEMHNEKHVSGKNSGLAEGTRRFAYEYDIRCRLGPRRPRRAYDYEGR